MHRRPVRKTRKIMKYYQYFMSADCLGARASDQCAHRSWWTVLYRVSATFCPIRLISQLVNKITARALCFKHHKIHSRSTKPYNDHLHSILVMNSICNLSTHLIHAPSSRQRTTVQRGKASTTNRKQAPLALQCSSWLYKYTK